LLFGWLFLCFCPCRCLALASCNQRHISTRAPFVAPPGVVVEGLMGGRLMLPRGQVHTIPRSLLPSLFCLLSSLFSLLSALCFPGDRYTRMQKQKLPQTHARVQKVF
jgi:hypothetical protein